MEVPCSAPDSIVRIRPSAGQKHLLKSKHKGFGFQQVRRVYFITKPNGSFHEELE